MPRASMRGTFKGFRHLARLREGPLNLKPMVLWDKEIGYLFIKFEGPFDQRDCDIFRLINIFVQTSQDVIKLNFAKGFD